LAVTMGLPYRAIRLINSIRASAMASSELGNLSLTEEIYRVIRFRTGRQNSAVIAKTPVQLGVRNCRRRLKGNVLQWTWPSGVSRKYGRIR